MQMASVPSWPRSSALRISCSWQHERVVASELKRSGGCSKNLAKGYCGMLRRLYGLKLCGFYPRESFVKLEVEMTL